MHVMTKYLDTRKAAIAALQDYAAMDNIIETTDEQIKHSYADATSPASPRLDGTPPSGDLHAGEARIAATLDRIDVYRARYKQAVQYMDWFLPAWELLSDDDRFVLEAFFLTAALARTASTTCVTTSTLNETLPTARKTGPSTGSPPPSTDNHSRQKVSETCDGKPLPALKYCKWLKSRASPTAPDWAVGSRPIKRLRAGPSPHVSQV